MGKNVSSMCNDLKILPPATQRKIIMAKIVAI
jgi:hypothetical protein